MCLLQSYVDTTGLAEKAVDYVHGELYGRWETCFQRPDNQFKVKVLDITGLRSYDHQDAGVCVLALLYMFAQNGGAPSVPVYSAVGAARDWIQRVIQEGPIVPDFELRDLAWNEHSTAETSDPDDLSAKRVKADKARKSKRKKNKGTTFSVNMCSIYLFSLLSNGFST